MMLALALVVPVGTVRGDAAPSFLTEETFPPMRFDNLEDYPEFDFYLKYAHGRGNLVGSPFITQVQSGEAIYHFEGSGRNGGAYLLAVPRGQKPPPLRKDHDWLIEVPAGCFQSAPLKGSFSEDGYLVPYQVKIEDGKLEVMMQPKEWLPGAWSILWLKRLPCILVLLAFCVATGWLVARIARRLFPYSPRSRV
jgi:hypothetical protein